MGNIKDYPLDDSVSGGEKLLTSADDSFETTSNITVDQVKDYTTSTFKDIVEGPSLEGTEEILMIRDDLNKTPANYTVDDLRDYLGSAIMQTIFYYRNGGVIVPGNWFFGNFFKYSLGFRNCQ